MTFKLGLTGSIGMGKSTTAKMFVEEGCDLWDADAAVHRMYSVGGSAVEPMQRAFPDAIVNGHVSRDRLKSIIGETPGALKKIEEIVHPLVTKDRSRFLASSPADIVVFDIPLLFETGGETAMDAVACVSVSPELQKTRVMLRGTMTEDQFEQIRAKQMDISEKRERSDFVIVTETLEEARTQVQDIVKQIRKRQADA